jgi:hypothetical protein
MLAMIIDEIRKQIMTSSKSLNQIGKETGIDKAALSRIMNGGSCRAETLEVLLNHFGYEIRKKKTAKKSRARK